MPRPIRIGTSGWNYKHWREIYYPRGLSVDRWFAHYAADFDTVEINNTFYQLPPLSTFDAWRQQAPAGFLYAVKANRYLTHMLKLKDPADPLERLLSAARRLGPHLGPILFQLPPGWKKNAQRLQDFCAALPPDIPAVLEFRSAEWLDEQIFQIMNDYDVSLCIHDMLPNHPRIVTGRIAYVRFHGATGKYNGKYTHQQLQPWAEWLLAAARRREAYVYFNNDIAGHALENAQMLLGLVHSASQPPSEIFHNRRAN